MAPPLTTMESTPRALRSTQEAEPHPLSETGSGSGTWNTGVAITYSSILGASASVEGTGSGATNSFGAFIDKLSGGVLTTTDVTTDPDDDSEKGGNFFNILPALPLLLAKADSRSRQRSQSNNRINTRRKQPIAAAHRQGVHHGHQQ